VNLNRKTVAWIITAAIALMTINVTYRGIASGVGLIPGASFLLWTIIALTYTAQEEVGDYIRKNHHRVTEPAREQALNIINWTRETTSPQNRKRLKTSLQVQYKLLMNGYDNLTDQIHHRVIEPARDQALNLIRWTREANSPLGCRRLKTIL